MKPSKRLRKIAKQRRRLPLIEQLESRQMLTADWQNPLRPLDVNNDALLSPLDALLVINRLNDSSASRVHGVRTNHLAPYDDTNGDGLSSPIDALLVINALNQQGGAPLYPQSRIEGESAGVPAGFISIPFMQLPGATSEIIELQTSMTVGGEEFHELGFFVVDTAAGHIDGVAPDAPNYPEVAFERAQRKSLYSSFDTARLTNNAVFQGGQYLRIYVLQQSSPVGEAEAHLKFWQTNSAQNMRIGWEEQVSIWPNPFNVGNRGYDDVYIDVTIGTPLPGNPPPVIGSIADRTIDEETTVSVAVNVMDANHDRSQINLQMLSGPTGANFNSATGQFSWTPSEADGPGQFAVVLQATDPDGATDTERFVINVLEVNLPPLLQTQQDLQIEPGDMITFFARATDPDLPANTLTYSLANNVPAGASIDPVTGLFSWTAPTEALNDDYQFALRVTDNGSPALSDTETFRITVGGCPFQNLDKWRVNESGGSDTGHGNVVAQDCSAVLSEGDSFSVTLETSVVIPENATEFSFTYAGLNIDTSDNSFINDAFEVALVDQFGNSLVEAYTIGRDAFFNVSEDVGTATGSGVKLENSVVTFDISGLLPGQPANLIFRLTNNDTDRLTTVRLTNFNFAGVSPSNASPVYFAQQVALSSSDGVLMIGSDRSVESRGPITVTEGVVFTPPIVGTQGPFEPEVEWIKSEFNTNPTSNNVMMTPLVIDLDRDGVPEVVFNTYERHVRGSYGVNNTLRAIRGSDGTEYWSVDEDQYEVAGFAGLAAADIDLDGYPEIIAISEARNALIAFEHDGTFKWKSQSIVNADWGGPAVADLDQDGIPEIIIGNTVLNNDGTIRWRGSLVGGTGTGNNGAGPLSIVADIDFDGRPDVIAGRSAYRFDGHLLWNASIPDGLPAVGQFDADPQAEIVVVAASNVYLLDHLGQVVWGPTAIPGGGNGGAPTIADMDGDGLPEIGVAGARNYVVFEHDGSIKWMQATRDLSSNLTGSSVFDFDGDGRAEVVYGDEQFLRIYDGRDGTVLYQLAKTSATTLELPVVADVDADGHAEIIAAANGSNKGIFVIGGGEQSWVSTRQIWNQHSYHITNINDDSTVPQFEPNSWEIYNNYRRNEQPTGTQLGRPLITVNSPASQFEAGTQVVLSGIATAQGRRSSGQVNGIATVFVNDRAVDVLDVAGNFFVAVDIQPGITEFRFTATDDVGQTIEAVLNLTGTVRPQGSIDFSQFTDTTGSFSGVYGRTSFKENERLLFVDLATRNDGVFESDVPLLVGVRNIGDPMVSVFDPDGFMPDGTPYFNFTSAVADGRLSPGEVSGSRTVAFYNPLKQQFDYDLVFFGKLNEAPFVTTTPKIEAAYDRSYEYDVDATDADNDTLTYSLPVAPAGMSINDVTGLISWQPESGALGFHNVRIEVTDGRGGIAKQSFTITINETPPNRPPVIVSIPSTVARASSSGEGGKIVVANDEWTLAETGFSRSPQGTSQFVQNLTEFFANGKEGNFLAYSNNHGLVGASLAAQMDKLGHTWTVSTNIAFDLDNLLNYDAVFLSGFKADNKVLIEYVNRGGSVYLCAGTGPTGSIGPADREADTWNTFLNAFGLAYERRYNGISGVIPIPESPAPIFEGVELYQNNGNSIIDLDPFDSLGAITARSGTNGLYAIYESNQVSTNLSYRYDAKAIDPDENKLGYSLRIHPEGMWIDPDLGIVRWSPTADQIGNHNVTVEVSDGSGGIAIQVFFVCVHPETLATDVSFPNSLPVFTSTNAKLATAGKSFNYSLYAQDADGDDVTFSLENAIAGMSISSQEIRNSLNEVFTVKHSFVWDVPVAEAGKDVAVTIVADDGQGGQSRQNWTLHIQSAGSANMAPVITSSPQATGRLGLEYTYMVDASDADGDSLTYSLPTAPSGMSVSTTGLVTWQVPGDAPSSVPLEILVQDGRGREATQKFDLKLTSINQNRSPAITSIPIAVAVVDLEYAYNPVAVDADGDALIWSLAAGPRGMSIDALSGKIRWKPDDQQLDTHIVTITATDPFLGQSLNDLNYTLAAITLLLQSCRFRRRLA